MLKLRYLLSLTHEIPGPQPLTCSHLHVTESLCLGCVPLFPAISSFLVCSPLCTDYLGKGPLPPLLLCVPWESALTGSAVLHRSPLKPTGCWSYTEFFRLHPSVVPELTSTGCESLLCVFLPNDIMLVAWNWPRWKYFHRRNWQILPMEDPSPPACS